MCGKKAIWEIENYEFVWNKATYLENNTIHSRVFQCNTWKYFGGASMFRDLWTELSFFQRQSFSNFAPESPSHHKGLLICQLFSEYFLSWVHLHCTHSPFSFPPHPHSLLSPLLPTQLRLCLRRPSQGSHTGGPTGLSLGLQAAWGLGESAPLLRKWQESAA